MLDQIDLAIGATSETRAVFNLALWAIHRMGGLSVLHGPRNRVGLVLHFHDNRPFGQVPVRRITGEVKD